MGCAAAAGSETEAWGYQRVAHLAAPVHPLPFLPAHHQQVVRLLHLPAADVAARLSACPKVGMYA